jgi:UDP-galactopyranose mutase
MGTPRKPVIVLGAGVAGLAASIDTQAPVYEASDRIGGVAAADHVAGFSFDRGIHVLQSWDRRVLDMLDEAGVGLRTHKRRAYIYSHGTYTPYPFQVNTAGLPLGLRARCLSDYLRRDRKLQPRNYEEWMHKHIGRGFAETFLIPYSEKFWTVHPREMTFDWTGNRVPHPSAWQVLRGAFWSKRTAVGSNATFLYPDGPGGYDGFVDAVARHAGPVELGQRATHVDTERRLVRFNDAYEVGYDTLIATIPMPDLVSICTKVPDAVRAAAARLRANSIMVVNIGVARPNLRPYHWVHFPEPDISFFRISYPGNFSDGVCPPGCSSISAEVSFSSTRPLQREGLVDRVVADLVRVGALDAEDRIVATDTSEIRYAYCIYDMHRRDAVQTIRAWLKDVGIVPTGRYGLWCYFWSHEAMLAGRRAGSRAAAETLGEPVS